MPLGSPDLLPLSVYTSAKENRAAEAERAETSFAPCGRVKNPRLSLSGLSDPNPLSTDS